MIKTLEYTWLGMSLLGIGLIIYKIFEKENSSQIGFSAIFTFVALVMYFYRHRQRIMMNKTKAEDTSDKYH